MTRCTTFGTRHKGWVSYWLYSCSFVSQARSPSRYSFHRATRMEATKWAAEKSDQEAKHQERIREDRHGKISLPLACFEDDCRIILAMRSSNAISRGGLWSSLKLPKFPSPSVPITDTRAFEHLTVNITTCSTSESPLP